MEAVYSLPAPPAGTTYTLELVSSQVKDPAGNFAAATTLATLAGPSNAPPAGEIEVVWFDGNVRRTLADGQAGWVDFGSVAPSTTTPLTRTFEVRNAGTAALALDLGPVPAGFAIVEDLTGTLLPGAADTFTIRMLASTAPGPKEGAIKIATNDPDENPFDLTVRGVVLPRAGDGTGTPEVTMLLNGAVVPAGTTLDFGTRDPGEPEPSITVALRNDGNADLLLGAFTPPAGFVVSGLPAGGVIAPGQSANLTITMVATAAGTYAAAMSIPTNDADENPLAVNLSGALSATLPPPAGRSIAVTAVTATKMPPVIISGGGGGKVAMGVVTVTLRNDTAGAFAGPVTLTVHASAGDGVLDAGDAHLATLTRTVKLRLGATGKPIKLKVPLAALPAGQQTLLATATANGIATTGVGRVVSVEAARVHLVGLPAAGDGSNKPLALGQRATLAVPLQNSGNVTTSKSPVNYTLLFTTDGTDATGVYSTTVAGTVNLKPGAAKPQKLTLTMPPPGGTLAAGVYTVIVRLTADLNATNGQTVALMPVTVV
jgi:hypothetical protein